MYEDVMKEDKMFNMKIFNQMCVKDVITVELVSGRCGEQTPRAV